MLYLYGFIFNKFIDFVANSDDDVTNDGIIALAGLPKLQKLKLAYFLTITDEVFKYFTTLKCLDLNEIEISNAILIHIAENYLELKELSIRGKFFFNSITYF